MIKVRTFKIRVQDIFEYIIALIIILDCNSVWNNIRQTRGWFQYLLMLCLVASVIGYAVAKRTVSRSTINRTALLVIGIVGYFFFYLLISDNSIVSTAINMMLALSLFTVYFAVCGSNSDKIGVVLKFRNLMALIGSISVVIWFLGPVMGVIQPTGSYYTNWTGNNNESLIRSYFGIHYFAQSISFFNVLYIARNTAIFNEAPMSSACFSIALMIECLYDQSDWKWVRFSLILAIITTFSTTGFLCIIFIYMYLYFHSNQREKVIRAIKILGIPLFLGLACMAGFSLYNEKIASLSGMARFDDFTAGFTAWLMNPIFGDGIGSVEAMNAARPIWRRVAEGFNSGIMMVLVQGGLYLGILYFFVFIKSLVTGIRIKEPVLIVFTGILFFIVLLTVITYNYIILFLMCFLLNWSRKLRNIDYLIFGGDSRK